MSYELIYLHLLFLLVWLADPHGNKVRRCLPQKSTALPQTYMGQTDRVLALMLTFFWGGVVSYNFLGYWGL